MPGVIASQSAGTISPRKSPRGKGKDRQSTTSPSTSDSPVTKRAKTDTATSHSAAATSDEALLTLAERIADSAHLLVRGRGDEQLAAYARLVAKAAFDKALESEAVSFPHLATLLASLAPSAAPATRSSTVSRPSTRDETAFALAPTPVGELTIEGMEPEMVWEQMELRGRTVDGLMDEMFGQTEEDEGEGDFASGDEDGDEAEGLDDLEVEEGSEDGSDTDISQAVPADDPYFRRLGEGKEEGLDSEDWPSQEEENEAEGEDLALQEVASSARPEDMGGLNLDNFDDTKRSRARRATGPPSAVDDAFFSLHDFHVDADEGEFEMEKMLRGEVDDLSDDDGGDEGIDLFASVDGELAGDDDDEEEEGDLDVGGLMYKDFFDPPSRPTKKAGPTRKEKDVKSVNAPLSEGPSKKRGVRFSDAVKVKEIPHRLAGRNPAVKEDDLSDEELLEGDEDDASMSLEDALDGSFEEVGEVAAEDPASPSREDDPEEEGSGSDSGEQDLDDFDAAGEDEEVIERFKSSLFDEDEEEGEADKNLSRHERRLLQLSSQIASLEAENVGPKDWATLGEAQSRDRPVNSLLEEDLEFERMGKVAPMVTEETTKTIEDLIKKRILDNQFDDVERRRPVDPNAFLPSRYMELQDTKSQKSLAEVYEDEFRDARDREQGREVVNELDKDLQKKHDEIEALFEDLAARLDALSNARFTPKAPKATITTVSNLPSISVESALPTTNSTSALLAPEEVYAASGSSSALAVDKADLTPAQKKAQRQKAREQRKSQHEKADRILEAKQRRKGVKGEKERAEQILLGTKGVTVIGKNGAEKAKAGKKRKRGDADGLGAGQPSSVALKL
ncbi:hypothetical protein JCM11251_008004 [Rhodosporidiobolus azoricus]